MIWTVAGARRRFAEFLRASNGQPQRIERYGELVGVMISGPLFEEFQRFQKLRSTKSVGVSFEAFRALEARNESERPISNDHRGDEG